MDEKTVVAAQRELNDAVQDTLADMGDDAPDEGSAAADIFVGLAYDWDPEIAAEVARREFGFVPGGAPQAVADEFAKLTDGSDLW